MSINNYISQIIKQLTGKNQQYSTKEYAHFEKQNNVKYIFDIDELQFYMYGNRKIYAENVEADYYFIGSEYYNTCRGYVYMVNSLLEDVGKEHKIFVETFRPSKLVFDKRKENINDFCMFFHHPFNYYHEIGKYPYSLSLNFESDPMSFADVYFDKCSNPCGGRIVCWQQCIVYSFRFKVYNGVLKIVSAYTNGQNRIFDIGYENYIKRKAEYDWICANLPDLAPKSLGGYTRMKHSNSKNYLKIKETAAKIGRELIEDAQKQ